MTAVRYLPDCRHGYRRDGWTFLATCTVCDWYQIIVSHPGFSRGTDCVLYVAYVSR